jgi:hypothetical protein
MIVLIISYMVEFGKRCVTPFAGGFVYGRGIPHRRELKPPSAQGTREGYPYHGRIGSPSASVHGRGTLHGYPGPRAST